ncbi:MAG: XAC2610-related protein [Bacteroidia bacterium]
MQRYLALIVFLFLSCQNKQHKPIPAESFARRSKNQVKNSEHSIEPALTEFFADSSAIGRKSFNKIEVAKYSIADRDYVIIKFYTKQNKTWDLRNEFHFAKDGVTACDPQISDFNRDGFNDMTYVSAVAASGANEVRRLFMYDKKNDKLVYLKNSEDYPNMLYNEELNCVDAFLISGCNTTVFLKIEKDSLREFASVDQCDSLTVSTYDRIGNEKVILKKKTNKGDFTRFKNYRPLEEYGE